MRNGKKAKKTNSLMLLEHTPRRETISFFPIPLDLGSDNGDDLANGPQYLLNLGLAEAFEAAGLKVKVLPEFHASKKHLKNAHKEKSDLIDDLTHVLVGVRDVVHREIVSGNRILSLGGDHALSIGTIAGASAAVKGDLGVIWIDVHGDIHTHATSLSQNPHGMSVTALMGLGDKRLTDVVQKKIQKNNVLALGYRDLDQGEIDIIHKYKIPIVTMYDIVRNGISSALDAVMRLNKKVSNVWVSLDMDSIDESVAPASAMASPGGFTHREIVSILTNIGKVCNVVGLDIVELTPRKDVDNKTGILAIELAAAAFGAKHNWYTRHMNQYGNWYSR